jgi:UDP-glucose 4-epimerase
MRILVTGGAGYIGSHTVIALLQEGHSIIVLDNFYNSTIESLKKISFITGIKLSTKNTKDSFFSIVEGDVRDSDLLDSIFLNNTIELVIHFAGLKSLVESIEEPIKYYDFNLNASINLFDAMNRANLKKIIFSSSAAVYGCPSDVPIKESFPLSSENPYGRSKLIIEEILRDIHASDSNWNIVVLRYFNPVGAHKSFLIGDNPNGIPNNLMPLIVKVAAGELDELKVFGGDYSTPDGTGVRDFIHVVDLANGHLAAVKSILDDTSGKFQTVNLGTGNGCSVLELITTFEIVSGKKIPYQIVDRRPGDIAESYTDPSYAKQVLDWNSNLDIYDMCSDSWNFKKNNLNIK